jgi:hypothetical protein
MSVGSPLFFVQKAGVAFLQLWVMPVAHISVNIMWMQSSFVAASYDFVECRPVPLFRCSAQPHSRRTQAYP